VKAPSFVLTFVLTLEQKDGAKRPGSPASDQDFTATPGRAKFMPAKKSVAETAGAN